MAHFFFYFFFCWASYHGTFKFSFLLTYCTLFIYCRDMRLGLRAIIPKLTSFFYLYLSLDIVITKCCIVLLLLSLYVGN